MATKKGKPKQQLIDESSLTGYVSSITPSSDGDTVYRTEQDLVWERFELLGGGVSIEEDVRRAGIIPDAGFIADHITPLHRQIVSDLASAHTPERIIAKVMGISQERLEAHFRHELDTAASLMLSHVERSLRRKAVAGDTTAGVAIMRGHPSSGWRARTESTGLNGGPLKHEVEVEADDEMKQSAQALLAAMAQYLSTKPKGDTVKVAPKPKQVTR